MPISPRLVKRLISAAVMIPLALVCLIYEFTFIALMLTVFFIAAWEWRGLVHVAPSRHKVFIALVGITYLPLSFACFAAIRNPADGGDIGIFLTLALLIMVWLSDTGAYVMGKIIGGRKWVPSISPNKTWAGLAGAMLFPALAFFLIWSVGRLIPALATDDSVGHIGFMSVCFMMIFLAFFGFICQMGDLFISLFKRLAGVKDTGDLIPGHGGVLDRIDSLMLASVVLVLLYVLMVALALI